jgi:hypothetical protein
MKSISLFIGTLVFYLFLVGFVNAQTERKYTYQALDIQLPPGTVKIIELADLNTDRGEIVGTGADAEHKWHGLIINRFTGVAARFDCDGPGSETVVNATHNGGSVAGACVSNAYGPPEGRVSRGFIYRPQAGGERIFFQPGNNPEVTGINDDGGCVLTYNVMEIPNGPNGHYAAPYRLIPRCSRLSILRAATYKAGWLAGSTRTGPRLLMPRGFYWTTGR